MKRIRNAIAAAVLMFALLPVDAFAAEYLIPVGKVVGLRLQNDTVTIAAFDDALGTAAKDAGLRIGDVIVSIDSRTVRCAQDVQDALHECDADVALTVRRGSRTHTVTMLLQETEDGPKLGVYLRQGIAGIGTVTWYDPATGHFGTLGHGVSDAKGKLLNMTEGNAYFAEVLSVQKGKSGDPGQLKGNAEAVCGTLLRNTPQGVFGITKEGWRGQPIPVAQWEEIETGPATIRSTIQGGSTQEYSVEILKIYPRDRSDNRNFLLKVTDTDLLNITGGIVQGMSGSPICQNGKIVGAVTHVLVNDPAMGYGIFIKNMLEATQ